MTKADCHRVNCPAAGHVIKCAEKKDCPFHTKEGEVNVPVDKVSPQNS